MAYLNTITELPEELRKAPLGTTDLSKISGPLGENFKALQAMEAEMKEQWKALAGQMEILQNLQANGKLTPEAQKQLSTAFDEAEKQLSAINFDITDSRISNTRVKSKNIIHRI